jgi:hypothetical protein
MIIIPANSVRDTGFNVDNSVRMNDGSSDYFNRTNVGTVTSNQKFTLSLWVKRGKLGTSQRLYGMADNSPGTYAQEIFGFNSDNTLQYQHRLAGSDVSYTSKTDMVFRDISAWYSIVLAVDTTQGTDTNRVKIYVNGTQVDTTQSGYPSTAYIPQNDPVWFNYASLVNNLGALDGAATFDGYMSEVVLLDGTAASPTSFGEFDEDSGIWKPIDVSGLTFGNNGFYLDYEDSSALGNDANGGTDFTANNLTAIDQATDTPTNNFSTMNPLANKVTSVTFSEGNLKIDFANGRGGSTSTFGLTTGKWYVEYNITTMPVDERFHFGIVPREIQDADDMINTNNQGTAISGYNAAVYADSGSGMAILNNFYGNDTTRFDSFTGIIGMALDMTNGTIAFSKAGAWVTGSGATDTDFSNALKVDISTPLARHDVWHIGCGTGNSTGTSGVFSINFGSPAFSISSGNADGNGYGNFEYAVPSGYYSLNTKNLADYG